MIKPKQKKSFQSITNFQHSTERVASLLGRQKQTDQFDITTNISLDKRLFDDDYLLKTQCTSLYSGPLEIPQQCYVCGICNSRKDHYICKHCYHNCHSQCREAEIKVSFNHNKLNNSNKSNTLKFKNLNNANASASFRYSIIGGLIGGNSINSNSNTIREFACYCGVKLKHKPIIPAKKEFIACSMMLLDEALEVECFYCENHQQMICCVCSVYCHKGCVITKKSSINMNNSIAFNNNKFSSFSGMFLNDNMNININASSHVCQCEEDKHTSYNEIALTFPLQEYQRLSGVKVCPIQILNILFSNKNTFTKLATLFSNVINDKELNGEMREQFYPLLELFSNTFNRKFKTYYYHEDILDMFPYEKLIDFIEYIPITNSMYILVKFRLVFILLFIHLKKDFQLLKSLTSIDFISNNILERIEYKKMISHKTMFTMNIDSKYTLDSLYNEGGVLKTIAMDEICTLMEIGMDYVNIEENQDEFEIGLKYLCFMLKHMFFTKNDLIKLIYSLYRFHSKFFEYINSDKNNIYSLLDIFRGLSEIFYIITILYNDLVVEEYLEMHRWNYNKEFKQEEINDFIHVKSEYGGLLFKMVIKSCDVLKKHYELIQKMEYSNKTEKEMQSEKMLLVEKKKRQEKIEARTTGVNVKLPKNGGLFYEKVIKMFNETIQMFALADNIYFKQLQSISKDDLVEYYSFTNMFYNNETNSNQKHNDSNNGGNVTKENEIKLYNNECNRELEALYNMKITIESTLNDLFTFGFGDKNFKINSIILNSISHFASTMKDIINSLKQQHINGNNTEQMIHYATTYKQQDDNDDDKYIPSKLNEEKYNQYINNIKNKISKYFSFVNINVFNSLKERIINCLILSNIDETLSKIIMFFCMKEFPTLLTVELLDLVLSFLEMFFLTKRGMKYFLMGKNITRINKIFKRFKVKTNGNVECKYGYMLLNFMKNLCKGILLYKLSLKEHKILFRFKKNLIEHIQHFSVLSKDELLSNEFKEHCVLVMKILYYMSDEFEFEEFEDIKRKVINIFKDCPLNLLQYNMFKKNFVTEYNNNTLDLNLNEINNSGNKSLFQKEHKDDKILTSLYKHNNNNHNGDVSEQKSINNDKLNISIDFDNNISYDSIYKLNPKEEFFVDMISSNNNNSHNFNKSNYIPCYNTEIHNDKINISLYICFFNLVSKNTYYIFTNNNEEQLLSSLYNCITIKDIQPILNTTHFKLKHRTSVLKYLRTIYLIDKLDPYNIINQSHHLTTNEFLTLLKSTPSIITTEGFCDSDFLLQPICNYSKQNLSKLQSKYNTISNINSIIHLYIQELLLFPKQLLDSSYYNIEQYYIELLYGIKHISDFIYFEKNIWCKIILSFYELILEFLQKADLIIHVYHELNELGVISLASMQMSKEIENELHKIQSTSFNIYNKMDLYKCINETLFYIFNETKLNQNKSLCKYLEIYDKMEEANFTPFSLIETLDYEYFYEDNNVNDKLVNKDIISLIISNISDCFIKTFIDINNTNFLNVISTISNESVVIDYRKKIVDYFHSFMNSIEGNNSSKMESLLCVITKMLFYDGDEMQRRFEYLIDDKYFFANFNVILNQNIILTISLSRNTFAFERSLRITNLTKLIIQFLQSLGENFNTKYHNSIFTLNNIMTRCNSNNNNTHQKRNAMKTQHKTKTKKNILSSLSILSSDISKTISKDELIKTNKDNNHNHNKYKNKITINNDDNNIITYNNTKSLTNNSISNVGITNTIYESIIYNLKRVFYFLNMEYSINTELPYDKLIILSTNLIDFLIEYIHTTNDKEQIISNNFSKFFFGDSNTSSHSTETDNEYSFIDYQSVINILTLKIDIPKHNNEQHNSNNAFILREQFIPVNQEKYLLRKKIICYIKMKYVQLLISYLQCGTKEKFVNKLLNYKCGPLELFQEILYCFYELLQRFKYKKIVLYNELISIKNDDAYVERLINYYTFEKEFRDIIELNVCLNLYILIKIYEDMYYQYAVRVHFAKLKNDLRGYEYDKVNYNSNVYEDIVDIRSCFSRRVYLFLEKIVLKVEIKKEEEDNNKMNNINDNNNNISNTNTNDIHIEDIEINDEVINERTKRIVNKVLKQMNKKATTNNNNTRLSASNTYNNDDSSQSTFRFRNHSYSHSNIHLTHQNTLSKSSSLSNDTDSSDSVSSNNNDNNNNINNPYTLHSNFPYNSTSCINQFHPTLSSSDNEEDLINVSSFKKKKQPSSNQITFFIRPFLTFTLSEHSKTKFEETVTRTNATSKFMELVLYSDYCLFEMVVNYHTIGKSKFLQSMAEINFYHIELINYVFIIIQNILIMKHYYKPPHLDPDVYETIYNTKTNKLFKDNILLSFIQTLFLLISCVIWYYFKFANTYQLNLMKLYNRSFIFRKKGDKTKLSQNIINFFKAISYDNSNNNTLHKETKPDEFDNAVKVINVLNEINKDVSTLTVLYLSLIESMLINREINILLLSFILNIVYLCTKSCLCLAIPVLFIANLIPTLFDIFITIKMKYANMLTVLLFSYLIIYIFAGVTYFYMADLFTISDIFDRHSEMKLTESFCYSSVQCFLFILSQGVRAGGGIGDAITKVSFQHDPGFYMFRFVYDLLFFILIILLLGNVFLGIIVDTFAELRDLNTIIDNDKQNICFICQSSRDACLTRNIDFNRHVKNEHFIWNYVYFLVYLNVSNPNEFNRIENSVWNRLQEQDYGWFPMGDGE